MSKGNPKKRELLKISLHLEWGTKKISMDQPTPLSSTLLLGFKTYYYKLEVM